jgi:hypothetical protein
MPIAKIISGGQTGVDRAALDVALELGVPCGGSCPKGRWAEDGPIDARYPLVETETDDPAERTRRNVRDADGTLILARGELIGGTALTREVARELDRPYLVVDPDGSGAVERIVDWIERSGVRILNVAGPRESEDPGIHAATIALLTEILTQVR